MAYATAQDPHPAPVSGPPGTADLPLRESTEIQGDIIAGFKKDHVHLLFLTFSGQEHARRWLKGLRYRIATTQDVARFNAEFSKARRNSSGDDPAGLTAHWRTVSFTHPGLCVLAGGSPLPPGARGTLEAFRQGSAERKERLGDTGHNDPEHWLFGGTDDDTVHAVLTVAADRADDLRSVLARERRELATHKITIAFEQDGATLSGPRRGKEHFGFKDGVSEPAVHGFDGEDPDRPDYAKDKPGTRVIPAGEFVLGHPRVREGGTPSDGAFPSWMTNGSFHVVRRLAQDVPGWWAQVGARLKELKDAGRIPEDTTVDWMASRLVGRWRSGAPVASCPHADMPSNATAGADNDISFANDPEGRITPLFSHIRKSNPRDGLRLNPGDEETVPEKGDLDRRRIMRRGIPYGLPFDPTAGEGYGPDAPRGLVFVSYQADLVDQFEFIQRDWIESEEFPHRTPPVGRDPMVARDTSVPFPLGGHGSAACAQLEFRQFVRTEGSVYAFAPSLSALEQLAEGTISPDDCSPSDQVRRPGFVLTSHESVRTGKAQLTLQYDGNLTVHNERQELVWHSHTAGSRANRAELRENGELVLLDTRDRIVWSTPTAGNPGAVLVVGTDGDVLIRGTGGGTLWHTGTAH